MIVSRLQPYRTSMFPILLVVLLPLTLVIAGDPVARYDNCDIDEYYKNHRDGKWGWERNEIASLLLETHRQVVPSDAVSEFLSGGFSLNTTALSRQYATYTNTRRALADLDHGTAIAKESNNNVTIKTVHMIFTKTDIPVSDDFSIGWEPGYLWNMDELKDSLPFLDAIENELDYKDEAIAAIHDLHNLRPRHPIVHHGQRINDWFYNSCQECTIDQSKFTVEEKNNAVQQRWEAGRASNSDALWDETTLDGKEIIEDEDEGTDNLCVCTQEHALQPPKMARGEVARALLYMNLRYGNQLDGSKNLLGSPYLDLRLTDCHPLKTSADYDDDFATDQTSNAVGYFSRLVEWHLADPPNQREIDRNNAICRYYQGNRNPFVDFYEESWALLDFETIEREVCPGAARESDDDSVELDTDDNDDNDNKSDSAEFIAENENENQMLEEDKTGGYGCEELMPGDISFFMVKPSLEIQGADSTKETEDWSHQSFGLVSLVDLKPGMDIYVVGVDDEDPETKSITHEDYEGGTMKLEVPERGIPAGSFFGYGNRMYLGTEWNPIVETEEKSDFTFSVHQLYLYCVETMDNEIALKSGVKEEYKILAALSTTGKSFGDEGLPTYWDNFLESHSDVQLSEHFTDGVHYGLITLPKDASDSEVSGGYRYEGPTYTKHDPYAKALIDETYWEQINSVEREVDLTGEEGIYYKSGEEEQSAISTNSTEDGNAMVIAEEPQELDYHSGSRINTVSSLAVHSMAFVACILTYAMSL